MELLQKFITEQVADGNVGSRMEGYQALAENIGVCESMIRQWAYGTKRVQAHQVIPLERATDGVVSRFQVRPDIYPIEDLVQAIRGRP